MLFFELIAMVVPSYPTVTYDCLYYLKDWGNVYNEWTRTVHSGCDTRNFNMFIEKGMFMSHFRYLMRNLNHQLPNKLPLANDICIYHRLLMYLPLYLPFGKGNCCKIHF